MRFCASAFARIFGVNLLIFGLLLCTSLEVSAQMTGTITGAVSDPSRAVLPQVEVALHNERTGDRRVAATNEAGAYVFAALPAGPYVLEFTFQGFQATRRRVALGVAERLVLDVSLDLSTETEVVEVTTTRTLNTESTSLGVPFNRATVEQLPLSARNFTQLLALSPGTSAPLNNAAALGRGTVNISSLGARRLSNAYLIDGVDASNPYNNSAGDTVLGLNGIAIPSPDAIEEFRVQTGLYDAQYGRGGGASVSVITKSGTNTLHGSAFEFFRHDRLNANSFFFTRTVQPKPLLRQTQYGATAGGPIARDRLFFFASYQGMEQRNGLFGATSLSLPRIPADRSAAALGAVFGGQTGARGGVAIARDGSNINPVALRLLNYRLPNGDHVIPSPQSTAPGVNYTASVTARADEQQGTVSLDWHLGSSDRLAFRGLIADQPSFRPYTRSTLPGFGIETTSESKLLSLTHTRTFGAQVVNEARVGFQRLFGRPERETHIPIGELGLRRFNEAFFDDVPEIMVSGAFAIGYHPDTDTEARSDTYHLTNTTSWLAGRHQLRFGEEVRIHAIGFYNNNRSLGTLTFQSFPDFLLGLPGTPVAEGGNGTGFSNINDSTVASSLGYRHDRLTNVALFAQDDWRLSNRLTLNLGVRWDLFGLPVDENGVAGNFDPRLYVAPPENGSNSSGFVQPANARQPVAGIATAPRYLVDRHRYTNIAPRVGVVYNLTRAVVRAGYGIFYDQLSNQIGQRTLLSPPNYISSTRTGATAANLSFQSPFPELPPPSAFPMVPIIYGPPYNAAREPLSTFAIDPALRTPFVQQWSTNVQFQPLPRTVVEVGYVGTAGRHLPLQRLSNQALIATPDQPVNGVTTSTTTNVLNRVPYLGFGASGITWAETTGSSDYHSLQISATQRLTHGLQFAASYTFSKSLDDNSGQDVSMLGNTSGDQHDLRQARGLSDFDRTHRFVGHWIYAVPIGRALDRHAWGRAILGDWQIAGILTLQSGAPFSITDSSGATLHGVATSRASWASGATVETATRSGDVEDRLQAYFDPAAFVRAGTGFGNTGRNILRGPFQKNLDLSLVKRVAIRGSHRLELRVEAFNALNWVNFASPNSNVASAATFGVITATEGTPRMLQLAARWQF